MTITLDNLTYSYKGSKTVALKNVSATITPGTYVLLGENGAGKTTLLQIIAGLRYPTAGSCLIDEARASYRLPSVLAHTSFLGSEAIFPGESIKEMTRIHAKFYPNFDREMLEYNLREFGLTGEEKLKHLSFGNRHKAMVAYMLALRTEIALYDEPATGLDIESKETLRKLVARDTNEEQTVIISTHNIDDLRALYDGVIIISKSELLLCCDAERITSRLAFRSVSSRPDNALYCEEVGGNYNVIIPNDGNDDTSVDYRLLYLALRSENKERILNQINR